MKDKAHLLNKNLNKKVSFIIIIIIIIIIKSC